MRRKKLSPSVRDYHSLHWLMYAQLQQGQYRKAEQLLALMKKTMAETTYDNKLRPGYYENNYANMAAAFIVETERWDLTPSLFPRASTTAAEQPATSSHGAHGGSQSAGASMTVRSSNSGQRLPVFIRGLAAAHGVSVSVAKPEGEPLVHSPVSIGELEVAAVDAAHKGHYDQAIEFMKRAISLEEQMAPPSGPPSLIKPTHELFGEILLRAGKPNEAAEQFRIALLRQPNRARSLLGLARAATQGGDRIAAATAYSKLLQQWHQADQDLAELREAHDYLKQSKR
jgi:tetratricopeptide (TPR) repeat protein